MADSLSRALDDVVSRAAAAVRQAGWRFGLSPDEVDEVFQDVRIRLWNARGSEQISETSTSYVYKTAASAALDLIRAGVAADCRPSSLDVVDAPAPALDPEHVAGRDGARPRRERSGRQPSRHHAGRWCACT